MPTIVSNSTGGGARSAGTSWAGGVAPASTDSVSIAAGDTITGAISETFVNFTVAATGALTAPTAVTITLTGNLSNAGTIGDSTNLIDFVVAGTASQTGTLHGSIRQSAFTPVLGASGYPMTMGTMALSVVQYFNPSADASTIVYGQPDYNTYVQAQKWLNLAAQEVADFGLWPWLQNNFYELSIYHSMRVTGGTLAATYPWNAAAGCWGTSAAAMGKAAAVATLTGVTYTGSNQFLLASSAYQYDSANLGGTYTAVSGTTGTCTATTHGLYRFDLPADVSRLIGDPSYHENAMYLWEYATLDRLKRLRAQGVITGVTYIWAISYNMTTMRHELIVDPPVSENRHVTIAYSRILPTMTILTDVPAMPPNLHALVELGGIAYGEERMKRNWASVPRKQFNEALATEYSHSGPLATPGTLRAHNHCAMDRFGNYPYQHLNIPASGPP